MRLLAIGSRTFYPPLCEMRVGVCHTFARGIYEYERHKGVKRRARLDVS